MGIATLSLKNHLKLNKKPGICIVTYPRSMASVTPLLNLAKILSELSNCLFLITGNEGEKVLKAQPHIHGCSINYQKKAFIPLRLLDHVILQIKIAIKIIQFNKNVDFYIFYMGEGLVLPMLICKITRKNVSVALAGSLSQITKNDKESLSNIFVFMEHINYFLADKLIIYSKRLINEWGLQRYSRKTCVAHEQFIDIEDFKIDTSGQPKAMIGFIGRMSEEKGILNFIKAIPIILQARNDVRFFIGGDGHLKSEVEEYLNTNNLKDKVEFCGWIKHDELPEYFSRIRLLVLPSYTEGLPNIMIEAMACRTPVLATAIGAIPDVIINNQTGLLMESNSPECISTSVLHALNYSDLEQISQNAFSLVLKEFTFHQAVETYGNALKTKRHS